MVTRPRQRMIGWIRNAVACSVALSALGWATTAFAVVSFVADPTLPTPAEAALFTVDPYLVTNAQRGIATAAGVQRNLRQTFQLPTDINVGSIVFSVDVSNAAAGLQMRIYEVADVNTWNPGTLLHSFVFPEVVLTTNWLGIDFTGGNVFSLPTRATGTQGYGIEFSDNLGVDGTTLGQLRFNNDGIGQYAGGRYFTETNASNESRDIGLILLASSESPCDAGDVNCDMNVDAADLQIIADNFRKNGGRELGDLSGNGIVDFDDFGEWKTNYMGPALGAGAYSFLAVPEPSSMVLLFLAVAALPTGRVGVRRRHNSARVGA
jgi:hypothetical protein